MVPFSSFATGEWAYGPPKLERYNGVASMEIQGQAAPGHSTGPGDARDGSAREETPRRRRLRMDRISLQQQLSGAQAPLLYALSILVVFLSLAALYESWSIPVSVIMGVPFGVLGALAAATVFHMSNDVYFWSGCSLPSACRRRTRS